MLGLFDMIQHVLNVQSKLKFRLCHVVYGRLLRQHLIPNSNAFRRSPQYVPDLVVEHVWYPAPAALEFAHLQHVGAAKPKTCINTDNQKLEQTICRF